MLVPFSVNLHSRLLSYLPGRQMKHCIILFPLPLSGGLSLSWDHSFLQQSFSSDYVPLELLVGRWVSLRFHLVGSRNHVFCSMFICLLATWRALVQDLASKLQLNVSAFIISVRFLIMSAVGYCCYYPIPSKAGLQTENNVVDLQISRWRISPEKAMQL